MFKTKTDAYDRHLIECNARQFIQGQWDTRINTMERAMNEVKPQIVWIGDCVQILGTKMNAELPDRP